MLTCIAVLRQKATCCIDNSLASTLTISPRALTDLALTCGPLSLDEALSKRYFRRLKRFGSSLVASLSSKIQLISSAKYVH